MSDLIDRQQLIDKLDEHCNTVCQYPKSIRDVMCGGCPLGTAFDVVDEMPSAEPVRMKGMWVRKLDGVYCSVCNQGWDFITGVPIEVEGYNFCPNCGACMSEGEEDEP